MSRTVSRTMDWKSTYVVGRDLAEHHHQAGRRRRLTATRGRSGSSARDDGVEDGVRDLVAHLVGMAFGDRFRGEDDTGPTPSGAGHEVTLSCRGVRGSVARSQRRLGRPSGPWGPPDGRASRHRRLGASWPCRSAHIRRCMLVGTMPRSSIRPIDPKLASELLADWGFLADPDLPDRPGPAFLLVAIRAKPTRQATMTLSWSSTGSPAPARIRCATRRMTFASRLPRETDLLLGSHHRLRPQGRGQSIPLVRRHACARARIDGEVISVFESPAPAAAARRTLAGLGHREPTAWAASSVDSARRPATSTSSRSWRQRPTPSARYAAFVNELVARYRSSEYLRDHYPKLWTVMVGEEKRLIRDHAQAWSDGAELLESTKRVASGGSLTQLLRPF